MNTYFCKICATKVQRILKYHSMFHGVFLLKYERGMHFKYLQGQTILECLKRVTTISKN